MINIFIVDDHYLIREGLKKILDREIDISVVGEACNANEAMQFLKDNDCDIIVLDISMPGKSGLELLQELKVEKPKIKTLILSMHPEERFAIRTFIAGASGYITKERAPEELVKAIQKISARPWRKKWYLIWIKTMKKRSMKNYPIVNTRSFVKSAWAKK